MSVLRLPRLYFKGLVSWDPGVVNNNPDVYDGVNVKIDLPSGVTYQTFKQWVIDNLAANGIWNYYGTHTCQLPEASTFITGGALAAPGPLITSDPIIGKSVALQGKLVDLDPASVFTSQLFFEDFSFGDGQAGITAQRFHRMHSRWINFKRNLGQLPIAGNAAVVWQTAFPFDKFSLSNTSGSLLLTELQKALERDDAEGLMVRFCTYRTLYFQNGILNQIPQQPRNIQDLQSLYSQGEMFSNPAYSLVTGVIGVWNCGELASVPGGRYLAPSKPVKPTNAAGLVRLGPCVAELDPAHSVLSLDLNSTIPEIDISMAKADFGPLTLAVRQGGTVTPITVITPANYSRATYEGSAGIIDIAVTADLMDKVETGQLLLQVQQAGVDVEALTESEFAAQADDRDTYLNEAEPKDVRVFVTRRGKAAPAGTQVLIARYDSAGQRLAAATHAPEILNVGADGFADLHLIPQAPGFINIGLFPFAQGAPAPSAPAQLDIMAAFFACVRTLPFDNQFEAQTTDSQLTWSFIYENILRLYDLLNPVMSSPDIGLSLSDKSVWTTPGRAKLLKRVTASVTFEDFNHMPVTRELSAGRLKLLERFCDLVIGGTLPVDGTSSPVEPEVEILPHGDFRLDL